MSNALAEFFYPRELKNIITDLEGEQNLRREPLHILNVQINIVLSFMAVICLLMLVIEGKIAAFIAAIIMVCIIKFCIHFNLKYYKAFIYGEKQKFLIEKMETSSFRLYTSNPVINTYCVRLSDKKKVKMPFLSLDMLKESNVKIDEIATLYYSEKHKIYPAVDTDLFKQEFCLRKDLMNETAKPSL